MRIAIMFVLLASVLAAQAAHITAVPFAIAGGGMTITGSVAIPSGYLCATATYNGQSVYFCLPMVSGMWKGQITIGGVQFKIAIRIGDFGDFWGAWYAPSIEPGTQWMT